MEFIAKLIERLGDAYFELY